VLWQACSDQADRILTLHWNAVEALASVLLAQGTIDGWEAHTIIQQAIDPTIMDWRMDAWNTATAD
jgi:hypothetical protein